MTSHHFSDIHGCYQYESDQNERRTSRKNALRRLRDPDGTYYDTTQILNSAFDEDYSVVTNSTRSENSQHPSSWQLDVGTYSPQFAYNHIESSVVASLPNTYNQSNFQMQHAASKPSVFNVQYGDPNSGYYNDSVRAGQVVSTSVCHADDRYDLSRRHTELLVAQSSNNDVYTNNNAFPRYNEIYCNEFTPSPNNISRIEHENQEVDRYNRCNIGSTNRVNAMSSMSPYDEMRSRKMQFHSGKTNVTRTQPPLRTIEITPGHYVRLRGAVETWNAIQDDFYTPCSCICCNIMLFCIQDATYVLCPVCNDVSPIAMEKMENNDNDGGIGLGFTMDELFKWQNEILQHQSLHSSKVKAV